MCNKLEAKCEAQDDKLDNLRNRVRDLTHAEQVRDKELAHTQRQHSQVAMKVTEIESCLAKANAENVRLRNNVKQSKTRVAVLQAALQAQLDVETQVTLEIKAAKNDKRTLQKRLARAQDKAAQGTTPKLRSCSVTEFNKTVCSPAASPNTPYDSSSLMSISNWWHWSSPMYESETRCTLSVHCPPPVASGT